MTSPAEAALALLAAAVILTLPGAAILRMLRVRGFAFFALTPALSVSIVSVSAIVGPWLGMSWGWWVPAAGLAVVLVVLGILRRLLPAVAGEPAPQTLARTSGGLERTALRWGLAGVAAAAVLVTLRFAIAAGGLESITQNYDTVFHLNAVRYILVDGDASSFAINAYVRPTAGGSFYPAAWHDVVSLVIQLSGASIPAATNLVWILTAAVVWPLNVLFLTRTLVGPVPGVLAAAGVLAAGFSAFPYLLLYYGSVYPNFLANALLPGGLALALILLRQGREPALALTAAVLQFILYLPGLALSQPNAVFSLVFLLTPLIVLMVMRWFREGFRRSRASGLKRLGSVLVSAAVLGALLLSNPTFMRLFGWKHPQGMPFYEALLRGFTNWPSPTITPPLVLTILVVLGLYRLTRHEHRGWLVATVVLTAVTYAFAIGSESRLANLLIAPWYGNPDRIAALAPMFGVPLAAVGAAVVLKRVSERFSRSWLRAPVAAVVLGSVVAASSVTLWQMTGNLGDAFRVPNTPHREKQLDRDELALLRELDRHVPADALVISNPWNGSALAEALSDRRMLYPYMSMAALDEDRDLLRRRLDEIGTADAVCAAAQRLGVEYLLDFGDDLISAADIPGKLRYPGVSRAAISGSFELVHEVGHAGVYRLKDCAPSP